MSMYVGHLTEPQSPAGIPAPDEAPRGLVTALGRDMDNGRRVKFSATREALQAYFADTEEDAYIVVNDSQVIKVTGRRARDLWTTAGLDQQPS